MRLAAAEVDICDLDGTVAEVLDRRLVRTSAPLAVALSGGGDSVALLLTAARWASAAGRPLLVLNLNHRLRPESAAWTAMCAARAAALGADFRALAWEGVKPARGLPAAARAARHALLAGAARAAGARVVLMGHTADDVLEAGAMRAAGSTTPAPREWGPSPAWPEGRGLFLLRPLLAVRRAAIRAWLAQRGESWIEDPANDDLAYARARARRAGLAAASPVPLAAPIRLPELCTMDAAGVLRLPRAALRGSSDARAFLGIACLCAAGTTRPPSGAETARLAARLRDEGPLVATLAGARIEADAREVRVLREPGRTGLPSLRLAEGETAVWDGRFELTADHDLEVRALAGLASRLGKAERVGLGTIPAAARGTLPATVTQGEVRRVAGRALALERLQGACGLVQREPG